MLHSSARTDPAAGTDQPTLLLVVGAAGEPEYASNFVHQVETWKATAGRASAECFVVGQELAETMNDRETLKNLLQAQPRSGASALWLVLIGHGTFNGKVARFNLRGPDVSATELSEWLQPFTRPLVILNTSSASAPFLNALAGTNRVVITATRSGEEQNFARFGENLAGAFGDPASDLDRDDQISLLEAFLTASARVEEYYNTEGRLATEHALLDDNGDGKGTSADWYRGIRAVKSAKDKAAVDGPRARQYHLVLSPSEQALSPELRARRDEVELRVSNLQNQKPELGEAEYYQQLEKLMLELAQIYFPEEITGTEPAKP